MKTQPISQVWICTRCGLVNEIYAQPGFKDLCLELLSGNTGLVICRDCGQTEQVIFKNSSLELAAKA